MQFAKVVIAGERRPSFVLTKPDVQVFVLFARNKKAPPDERVVRLCVYDGQPCIWATDRTQVVTAKPLGRADDLPDVQVDLDALDLKSMASSMKVSESLVLPLDGSAPHVVAGKPVVLDDMALEGKALDAFEPVQHVTLGKEAAQRFASLAPTGEGEGGAVARWQLTSRFASVWAAIAKATADEDAWWMLPPATSPRDPLVVRVAAELDGATWEVLAMPLVPVTAPAPAE